MKNIIIDLDIKGIIKQLPSELRSVASYVVKHSQNRARDNKKYFEAMRILGEYTSNPAVATVIIYAMGPYIEREVNKFIMRVFSDQTYLDLNDLKESIVMELFVWLIEKLQQFDSSYRKEGYTGEEMYVVTYVERLLKRRVWGYLVHQYESGRLKADVELQTQIYTRADSTVDVLDYISEQIPYEEYITNDEVYVDVRDYRELIDRVFRYRRREHGVK